MGVSETAGSALLVMLSVFLLAGSEKVLVLYRGASNWHPVMLVSLRRRHLARILMTGSLGVDIITLTLLLVAPRAGGVAAMVLICAYTVAALPAHRVGTASECGCFFALLNTK